jgi:hypothetical protein
MLSAPPATTTEALPMAMVWAARAMALREEAQTLLTVVLTVVGGRPAARAHWRAGFWPRLDVVRCVLRLRRGVLGGQHVAEEDFFDFAAVQAGALDGGFDDVGAQLGRRHGRERSAYVSGVKWSGGTERSRVLADLPHEGANWGAGDADDVNGRELSHVGDDVGECKTERMSLSSGR